MTAPEGPACPRCGRVMPPPPTGAGHPLTLLRDYLRSLREPSRHEPGCPLADPATRARATA